MKWIFLSPSIDGEVDARDVAGGHIANDYPSWDKPQVGLNPTPPRGERAACLIWIWPLPPTCHLAALSLCHGLIMILSSQVCSQE